MATLLKRSNEHWEAQVRKAKSVMFQYLTESIRILAKLKSKFIVAK